MGAKLDAILGRLRESDNGGGGGSGDMTKAVYDPANIAEQLLGETATQNVQNKILDDTNTISVKDTSFGILDNLDNTKVLNFELSGITTGNTRTLSAPDASGTIVLTSDLTSYELLSNKATDFSTVNNTLYPSVQAVKTYTDGLVVGLLDYRGAYDASGNVFPSTGGSGTAGAILKGDMWIISVAGTLGGTAVQIGDSVIANTDSPGQTAGNWNILNGNISYVPEDVANKSTSTSLGTSDTLYPTQNAVKSYVDTGLSTKAGLTANTFTDTQTINKNTGSLTAITGELLHKGQADGTAAIDITDAFDNVPIYAARRANGTNASKTDIALNDAIGRYEFRGYANGAYTTARGRLEGLATENWSGTAHGTAQLIYTTENGTTTMTEKARFDHDGKLNMKQIAPSTNPASGFNSLYFKSDDKLYKRTSAGVETEVGGGGAGGLTRDLWYSLTGTYASTSTFTTTEASNAKATRLAGLANRSLFTCTDSTGATRRIGYIKSATASTTTITYTVVTDTDLASGDKDFRITPNIKVEDYVHRISIPGEIIADASNPQGVWLLNVKLDSYLLPVNSAVRTAAAGSGAACAWNIYKGTTNLFTSAQDMTTNITFDEKRPNTNTISSGDNISLRITSSAGATNKASDFQAELFIIPQTLYTSQ